MKNSSYLDRPLIPLAVALARMLARIEAQLTTARPEESGGSNTEPSWCTAYSHQAAM